MAQNGVGYVIAQLWRDGFVFNNIQQHNHTKSSHVFFLLFLSCPWSFTAAPARAPGRGLNSSRHWQKGKKKNPDIVDKLRGNENIAEKGRTVLGRSVSLPFAESAEGESWWPVKSRPDLPVSLALEPLSDDWNSGGTTIQSVQFKHVTNHLCNATPLSFQRLIPISLYLHSYLEKLSVEINC